ncbi:MULTISPECIES: PP2C family serine/threonine-protein phosphatase [unclassified Streptomyces]|uniref:PP2C family protein-serine/threonine phosphatase n=1 Tax=unclassified Streptomyces TaxID=2593676 RepID=UPI001F04AA00|nr:MULTISPECIES: PP2C family serine/threonine-protein phosphatase [unclassified Streptomyces]MCH0562437.1 serine/threonine-protein phosphatase [Streptomyces sp. MUM 2J]MCH0570413.1 serine/threonine-protein phosphatase [Streptomyces sp. MUM 136J]
MAYVAVSALSHPGLLRERNEDSLAVGPWTLCATVTENPQTLVFPLGTPLVVAVADGLGGHPGGHLASSLAVRRIASLGPVLSSADAVREALHECNRAVFEAGEGAGSGELTAMGTTVAGIVVQPESLLVFNVGDSRVFAHSPGGLRQMSVDDSPPLRPGQRTTSMVTQCLGGSPGFRDVEPHVTAVPRTPGERYLLCSDGLTDPVPPEVVDELLCEHDDGGAAFALWKAAIEAGGPDNITVALVRTGDG